MGKEPTGLGEKFAAEYHARWEAVETAEAQELAALTMSDWLHGLNPKPPA